MQSILAFIKHNKWIVIFTLLAPLLLNIWLYHNYKNRLATQREINSYLISEVEKTRSELQSIQHLDSLKSLLLAKLDITQILTSENNYRYELYVLLTNLPEGISLQALEIDNSGAGIYGVATSTQSMQLFVSILNDSSLCGHAVELKPENAPGSFVIVCEHDESDYDYAL